ncbi:fumarylacetoacetate hydrolase family protein [Nitratireductor kimnyeongensis]|uniref:Fumarylacetoacetate hydrolase family protein n=1 Tax=Nitratireductor kimnyeongensis TaxID=430679 RepID=A0ABW0TAN5_9HYPH|nr:fumarylacetoacetate hydrolase family protein [Nitratireductor kimnyeongensis]QZZ36776.1 fumarylacetoacetate hydrolase family protein [Nitratireductor kimnyeongensis]
MRFVTFESEAGPRAGVLVLVDGGERVLDLAHRSLVDCLAGTPADLLAMIEAGLSDICRRMPDPDMLPDDAVLPLESVRLLAPLPSPPRIVGAAHNYRCAVAERGLNSPDAPVLFEKLQRTVVGSGSPVVLPAGAGGVTYEAELAVVIGKRAHRVSPDAAMDHVAGYTLFNDVSASEIIKADGNFERGKNFSTFGPMGPWLATPDAFDPAGEHRITLSIDGDRQQDGSISDLIFGIADLISRISQDAPLAPGTVIATGTPAGVAAMKTPPSWLKAGSVMTVEIEGLGRLTNPIMGEDTIHG